MNKWHEKLGCEVNVCHAKHCDAGRMQVCALRKAYQERVVLLTMHLNEAKGAGIRKRIRAMLKGLGRNDEA